MKIRSGEYSKTFPIAQYGINERVGFSYDIDSNETELEALGKVRAIVLDWAKNNLPEYSHIDRDFPVQIRTISEENPYPVETDPTDIAFNELKKKVEEAETKEEAWDLFSKGIFKHNIELKKIAHGKVNPEESGSNIS